MLIRWGWFEKGKGSSSKRRVRKPKAIATKEAWDQRMKELDAENQALNSGKGGSGRLRKFDQLPAYIQSSIWESRKAMQRKKQKLEEDANPQTTPPDIRGKG